MTIFRGSLPFVLAFATSVLRVLRYPLLPHQTVHTSLCQLIVNASTISSKYSAIAKGKGQSTAEIVGYVKKIGNCLHFDSLFLIFHRYESCGSDSCTVEENC